MRTIKTYNIIQLNKTCYRPSGFERKTNYYNVTDFYWLITHPTYVRSTYHY